MVSDVLARSHVDGLPEATRSLFLSEWRRRKKDKNLAVGLSCLCFAGVAGVGRIYVGQVGLGVALMLLNPLTCGLWSLVDLFFVSDAAEMENSRILVELQGAFPVQG